jgi:hypothetical protein
MKAWDLSIIIHGFKFSRPYFSVPTISFSLIHQSGEFLPMVVQETLGGPYVNSKSMSFDSFGDMDEKWHHFFESRVGKFVSGDRGLLPGDKICFLFGGSEAFVLRDHGRFHTVVGCAYTDGMEDGHLDKRLDDESNIYEFESH